MKKFSCIVLVLFFFGSFKSRVDAQAIRFNYFCGSFVEHTVSKTNLFYGIGYEQNFGKRIALSLEYNKGFGIGENDYVSVRFRDANQEGYDFDYLTTLPWSEFAYQAKYFFADNDEDAGYISSGISVRSINARTDVVHLQYDSTYISTVGAMGGVIEEKITLFPISIKFGYRGSIDGFFGDYFVGIHLIPGAAGKNVAPKLASLVETKFFSATAITFGMSFGIGWE